MNGKERILAMIEGKPVDRLPLMPITMMFAADRVGKPYGKYAADHRVLVEGQLKTAEEFGFDYVSCISDPCREAADCGAAIQWFEDQPPAVDEVNALLADKVVLASLSAPHPLEGERMRNRVEAAALLSASVGEDLLVEGWIEGPCAEAADLRGINRLMMDFFDDPVFVTDLFAFVVEMELAFAKAQGEAGVELMGVGDAAASLVGPRLYEEFVWPYEKRLVEGLHDMGLSVRLHICGDTTSALEGMGKLGCEIVDLDFMVSMEEARRIMGEEQLLLGNIDPVKVVRNGTPEIVYQGLAACHRACAPRYIVGAGCEIPRGTPDENLMAMTRFAWEALPAT